MSATTSIAWTDCTWSPLRARRRDTGKVGQHCERVSPGCGNCYAATWNRRNLPNGGTGLDYVRASRELVETFGDERVLAQPLRWRKPKRIFVENQSDLFADFYTDEQRDRVFAVMAMAGRHTFQLLTKRPKAMRAYMQRVRDYPPLVGDRAAEFGWNSVASMGVSLAISAQFKVHGGLANVWLGVTAEDQQRADERIPVLLDTPAAVRFVSVEPMLGPLDISAAMWGPKDRHGASERIDWVIAGGESGPGARPCDVAWIRSILKQCAAARVPCFVKQLGAEPYDLPMHVGDGSGRGGLRDRKGGNPLEWPEDLRVREFPR